MRTLIKITLLSTALSLSGCASNPHSYQDYPRYGYDSGRSHQSTVAGAAIGAATGAVLGHQIDRKKGRYVGAAAGALLGGAIGKSMDDRRRDSYYEDDYYERQRRYEQERGYGSYPEYGYDSSARSYPYRDYPRSW